MGFNKRHVTESVDEVKAELERKGLDEFVRSYRKYDALIGNTSAVNFIMQTITDSLKK